MSGRKHKYDNLFIFLERDLIRTVLSLFILFLILNHLSFMMIDFQVLSLEKGIQNEIREALSNLKDPLLSIAAIFIGIYVTVFTLLGSIRVDSIFAFLNERTFEKLVVYIRNAFIAAFLYLIIIIFLEVFYDSYLNIDYYFIILNMIIVLYMFMTALRLGIVLYLSFKKDLSNIQKNIDKQKKEYESQKDLQIRIEKFLEDFEEKQSKEEARKISELNKDKKEE